MGDITIYIYIEITKETILKEIHNEITNETTK